MSEVKNLTIDLGTSIVVIAELARDGTTNVVATFPALYNLGTSECATSILDAEPEQLVSQANTIPWSHPQRGDNDQKGVQAGICDEREPIQSFRRTYASRPISCFCLHSNFIITNRRHFSVLSSLY